MAFVADAVRTSNLKVLYRGSVPELLRLYHKKSPNVYWTASDVLALAPDWANASTFTANSYTPSANGWIQATYRIDTTQYGSNCSITIAGKSVLNAVNNRDAANYNYTDSIVVPVRKGATVTFSTANGGAFTTRQFVPSVIAP